MIRATPAAVQIVTQSVTTPAFGSAATGRSRRLSGPAGSASARNRPRLSASTVTVPPVRHRSTSPGCGGAIWPMDAAPVDGRRHLHLDDQLACPEGEQARPGADELFATAELMVALHGRLAHGASLAGALCQARRAVAGSPAQVATGWSFITLGAC
jgi:hypothetical protein